MQSAPTWLDQIVLLKQVSSVSDLFGLKLCWEMPPSTPWVFGLWCQANSSLK